MLENALEKGRRVIGLKTQSVSCAGYALSRVINSKSRPVIWICPDRKTASTRARELKFFLDGRVREFPSYEHAVFLPLIPSPENSAGRIAALYDLLENRSSVVVMQASALAERVIPRKQLSKNAELVMAKEETDREELLNRLVSAGYEPMTRVERVGEFSVRGEIVDCFPPGCIRPVRLVFFDDLVEEIRTFDPDTQRTAGFLDEVILLPAREIVHSEENVSSAVERVIGHARALDISASEVNSIIQNLEQKRETENSLSIMPFIYDTLDDVLSYAPEDALVIIEDGLLCQKNLEDFLKRVSESHGSQHGKGRLTAELHQYYSNAQEISSRLSNKKKVILNPGNLLSRNSLSSPGLMPVPDTAIEIACIKKAPLARGALSFKKGAAVFSPFAERIIRWKEQGTRVVICCQAESSMKRMTGLLEHYGIPCTRLDQSFPGRGFIAVMDNAGFSPGVYLVAGFVAGGFEMPDQGLALVPDHELFSFRPARRGKKKTKASPVSISDIREGDLVVHRDHGIGRYLGLSAMTATGIPGEFINLEYRGGDKLYLPVDRLGLLQRYVGVEGREPKLDKLGTGAWTSRKRRIKKAIREIAHELVELYAARKVRRGISLSAPDEMYRQFEAAFPFQETRDQLDAVSDILADLAAEYPMDRLLCGDVGFGKTEVAMRAAFRTVQDGYQVAVLVPTTLLAEQHERTFKRRFNRFPVTIESISRFKTRQEQRQAVEALRAGTLDILIGTHRILQKDIVFKRLGLVIIDEEHRFGVRHKERLKLLSRNVNCLTLTATPIPRTLQLSLLGIRDLSTLETPPSGRQSVRTFLAEYDDAVVREAVKREIDRMGQVFFVHNRVKGIQRVAEHLQRIVPEAKVDVAHGQMAASELEDIMVRFVRGEINCLVCTTIIESGLDIPSANTLLVNRADRLGIADLYQLRGRIGRSSQQAYAYLLVPGLDYVAKDAASRLRAIMETSRLGSGMSLAMHDLKIRGAGNILGVAQAGQIAEVGYDLYLDLLKEAVDEIRGSSPKERIEPEINLPVPAFIPEDYVSDVHERLELYRRLGTIEDETDEEFHAGDMLDRFGPLPEEVLNLLKIMRIKEICRKLGCVRLDGTFSGKSMLILTFSPSGPSDPDALLNELKNNRRFSMLSGERLAVTLKGRPEDHMGILDMTLKTLHHILTLNKD